MLRNILATTVHRICQLEVSEHRRAAMRKKKVNPFRHPILWLKQKWRKLNW